jgi:hypothetical protein
VSDMGTAAWVPACRLDEAEPLRQHVVL